MPKASPKTCLTPGQIAPDFSLPAHDGKTYSLAALRGKRVVLFFYPADNTPTCSTENSQFAAQWPAFQAAGVTVLGISRDSLKKHEKFAEKLSLPFPLLSDEDGTASAAYDVWHEKHTFGKTYMGLVRTTFLIEPDGTIGAVWPVTRLAGHVDEVLTTCLAVK